jgi:hypothetical protein
MRTIAQPERRTYPLVVAMSSENPPPKGAYA